MNSKKESLTIISEDEYYAYLRTVNSFSFLQEPAWGNVKSNCQRVLLGIYQEQQLSGVAMVLVINLFSKYTALYIARGPIFDYSNEHVLHTFRDGIIKLAKENNAIFVRTDPNVVNESLALQDVSNYRNSFSGTIAALKKAGFHHNGFDTKPLTYWQPRIHKVLPLFDKTSGELLPESGFLPAFIQNMPKRMKHIFCNGFHEKRGVSFKLVKGPHDLSTFTKLMKATEERQHITLRNKEYYERIAENFKDRAYFYYATIDTKKYIAYQQSRNGDDFTTKDAAEKIDKAKDKAKKYGRNIVISTCLVIMPHADADMKIAEYIYAGGNNFFPDVNSSRGLIYTACLDALRLGCKYFNLASGDPGKALMKFKNTFHPDTFEYIGEFDLAINKLLYVIFIKARNLRSRFRRLKHHNQKR